MKTNNITLENNPELFEDFDDSTIMYISENIDNISNEELQEIIEKELAKYH